jgi:DNA-dependent RNA polymerase auxiliary subunit epsilon
MREDFNSEFLDAVIKMRVFQRMNDTEFKVEFEHKVDTLIQEWNNHMNINQKMAREALKF